MTNRVSVETFHPGEFLREELEARGMTPAKFAKIIHRSTRLVNEIIAGKRSISIDIAEAIAPGRGTSSLLWMNLEAAYQFTKTQRLALVTEAAQDLHTIRQELKELRKLTKCSAGW